MFLRKYVVFTYTLIPLKPLKQINKISNINSLHKYDCAVLLDCAFPNNCVQTSLLHMTAVEV